MKSPQQPQSIAEVIATATQGPQIAARLEKKLGLGTNPEVRRELYQRVETLVCDATDPEAALDVVTGVVSDACDKSDPGRYFAYVVLRRLSERGFGGERNRVQW